MGWMQAVSVTKDGRTLFAPYPGMEPLPGELSLTVRFAGVSLDDALFAGGAFPEARRPRVPGREIVGCDDLGHFYTVWPATVCGRCARCEEGKTNLCVRRRVLGLDYDGGWGECVAVPEENLVPLPPEFDPLLAVLAEPLARCVCAMRRLPLRPGALVLVSGDLVDAPLAALAARAAGFIPSLYCTAERHDARLRRFAGELELEYGELCRKRYFDGAVSASLGHASLGEELERVLPGGAVLLLGASEGSRVGGEAFWRAVRERELSLSGAWGSRYDDMRTAVLLLATHADAVRVLIDRVEFMREIPDLLPNVRAGEFLKLVACPAADVF